MIVNRAFQGWYSLSTCSFSQFNNLQGSSYLLGAYPEIPGLSIVSSENPIIPTAPIILGYQSIGGARLTLDNFHPLSPTLPTVMEVDIPLDATGEVGFENVGNVKIDQYC